MSLGQISPRLRERIRAAAGDRCGYCRSHQRLVLGHLEIDHIVPQALGGTDDEENLWLACRLCNGYKGTQVDGVDLLTGEHVSLFNPRRQRWSDHFRWSDAGDQVEGLTACGPVTVRAVQMNHPVAVMVRRAWISAGWHPPDE